MEKHFKQHIQAVTRYQTSLGRDLEEGARKVVHKVKQQKLAIRADSEGISIDQANLETLDRLWEAVKTDGAST